MGITAMRSFHQFFDNMIRCRLVRIAHTEVDNVLSRRPGLLLEVTNDIENVWRKALYAPKVIVHDIPTLLGAPLSAPRLKKGSKQY